LELGHPPVWAGSSEDASRPRGELKTQLTLNIYYLEPIFPKSIFTYKVRGYDKNKNIKKCS